MNSKNYFAPIAALDLDPIKVKLMHEESGEGWSRAYADTVEFEYRRFLYVAKKFPNEHAAPLFDVDVFWHYHILDTMKYAADCEAVFGYFLHHFPYVGLRGEEDLEAHHGAGERMRELYELTFGKKCNPEEEPAGEAASGKVAFCSPSRPGTFLADSSKVAFCSPSRPGTFLADSSKVAFCSPSRPGTFLAESSKVAFCSPAGNGKFFAGTNKNACLMPSEKAAFCSPNVAFFRPAAGTDLPGPAVEAAHFDAPIHAASKIIYSVRPALACAA